MDNHQIVAESLWPQDIPGAALTHGANVDERLATTGIYEAVHMGPRSIYRARAEKLVLELDEIESKDLPTRLRLMPEWIELKKRLQGCEYERQSPDERFKNTVMDSGARLLLDSTLAGSAYTTVGPYMMLISSVSYTAIAAGDTMAQIAGTNGWREAGGTNAPTYSGGRKAVSLSAAATRTKSTSSGVVFTFTGAGTTKGCAIISGTGALTTNDNTAGTLYSAGLFAADKVVASSDTLTVTYSTTA